ncbi:UVRAG [Mytilus edulis]|uniref:UVRAG n=1 Tax=Mytilus edulis TaxID=6550 RepID=A0A8S3V5X4_MYTED|nr:UVRAG [Mytilus edulis]
MENSSKVARNYFELSSYQRRLRHLRCLALRNLCWPGHKGKDLTNLQSYFTLHTDRNVPAFYTSEKIQGSLNPTWQSFDISRYEDNISTRTRFLVVKVWVGIKDNFDLLIDWDVNLMGLVFFADKLQQDTVKYASNSLIFGMFDKYFAAPEVDLTKKPELSGNMMNIDSSAVRNSYRATSVSRIYTVLRATKQTQATVNKFHTKIEDKLLSSQEKSQKLSSREALIMKREQLRSELTWQMSRLQLAKDDLDKQKNISQKKEEEINERFLQLKKKGRFEENFIKEEAQWKIRRKQLISELETYVYPITENKKKDLLICHVKLPDSENFHGCDDTQVAVALGYTAHMVTMMSHILDVPLRYPIVHRSSRSQIMDHIHHKLTDKDNTFPLYSKGKEKFYFNYGVYLLNKDIGQLRFYCGMGTADLRTTLQNIKTLLELRLGTKVENQNRLHKPNSDIKDKNYSDIDTHSSLASGGRLSAPDSTDMVTIENVLAGTKTDRLKRENDSFSNLSSANSNANRQILEDHDSEEIHFHPSPDDNFFKISNPVSDKSDLFNDIDAIDSSLKVTELVDFSEFGINRGQYDRTDSLDVKARTDSNLTNNSGEGFGGKNLILESQMSTLSTTEYHQNHSDFKTFLSIGASSINSVDESQNQNASKDSSQKTFTEPLEDGSYEADHNLEDSYIDKKLNADTNQTDSSVQRGNCNKTVLHNTEPNDISSKTCDEFVSVVSNEDEEFPEIQRTFKTLSFRQTTEKPEDIESSCVSENIPDSL